MRTDGLSINLATVREQMNLREAVEACRRLGVSMVDPWRDQVAKIGLDESARVIKDNGMHDHRLLPRRVLPRGRCQRTRRRSRGQQARAR